MAANGATRPADRGHERRARVRPAWSDPTARGCGAAAGVAATDGHRRRTTGCRPAPTRTAERGPGTHRGATPVPARSGPRRRGRGPAPARRVRNPRRDARPAGRGRRRALAIGRLAPARCRSRRAVEPVATALRVGARWACPVDTTARTPCRSGGDGLPAGPIDGTRRATRAAAPGDRSCIAARHRHRPARPGALAPLREARPHRARAARASVRSSCASS